MKFRLFSIMSLVILSVASMGTFAPSAVAGPAYKPLNVLYMIDLIEVSIVKQAVIPSEERTYIYKPLVVRSSYKAETRNIAITHFVKGGGVSYTRGGKAVSTS